MSGKLDEHEKSLKEKKTIIIQGTEEAKIQRGLGVSISGSGIISDETIRVSGSARLPGGIKVKIIRVSGSASIDGDATAREVKVSGSTSVHGTLTANHLRISGSFKGKEVKGDSMNVSGSCFLDGSVTLTDYVRTSGTLKAMEDVSAGKSIVLDGAFDVAGEIKTRNLQVDLHRSNCHARGGIEAVNVSVRKHETEIRFFGFTIVKHRLRGRLFAPSIKASGRVSLENVVCEDVSGEVVEIGEGCEISGSIRYSETINIAPTARVAKSPMKVSK